MKLWKSPLGYVNIMIMGRYAESLINSCLESGIRVRSLNKCADCMTLIIPAKDMLLLRRLARGSGCRVRIAGRSPSLKFFAAVKRSAVFLIALLLCCAAVFALSSRVWFIRVETSDIPESEIEAMLNEAGIYVGAPKRRIDLSEAARILSYDERVAYSKLFIHGTVMTAVVHELVSDGGGGQAVCGNSIVASKDCVISFISVESGKAAVKKGQAVHRGDVLITGDLSSLKEGYLVPAKGVVLGETAYTVSAEASAYKQDLIRSGNTEEGVSVSVFGFTAESRSAFSRYDEESVLQRRLGFGLPVSVEVTARYELIESRVPDTPEGTRERAKLAAQEKLSDIVPNEASILTALTRYNETNDGSITAVLSVTTLENVGEPTD